MSANFQRRMESRSLRHPSAEIIVGLVGAALVVLVGKLLARRQTAAAGETQEIGR